LIPRIGHRRPAPKVYTGEELTEADVTALVSSIVSGRLPQLAPLVKSLSSLDLPW
jgi:hypothetical protein